MVTVFTTDSQNNSDWKGSLGFSIQPPSQIKISKISLYYAVLYQAGHQIFKLNTAEPLSPVPITVLNASIKKHAHLK